MKDTRNVQNVIKQNFHFMCMSPFFGEIISRYDMNPYHCKLQAITEGANPKIKKDLQSFLGIMDYLSKFSPATVDVYQQNGCGTNHTKTCMIEQKH